MSIAEILNRLLNRDKPTKGKDPKEEMMEKARNLQGITLAIYETERQIVLVRMGDADGIVSRPKFTDKQHV